MKVYTRTGDRGTTSLIGGKRVPKYDERIEAYGTLDELSSYIGLVRDQEINNKYKEELISIQDKLMICGSILATDNENYEMNIPQIKEVYIKKLESSIDEIQAELPPMRYFVLPGGHQTVSYCHLARTVCRRAERISLKLGEEVKNSDMVCKYLNRLSDYLFTLSRKLSMDLKADETPWIPKLDD